MQLVFQELTTPSPVESSMNPVTNNNGPSKSPTSAAKSPTVPKKDDKAAWFKLFAELDPLANPDSLLGSNSNQSHAA